MLCCRRTALVATIVFCAENGDVLLVERMQLRVLKILSLTSVTVVRQILHIMIAYIFSCAHENTKNINAIYDVSNCYIWPIKVFGELNFYITFYIITNIVNELEQTV